MWDRGWALALAALATAGLMETAEAQDSAQIKSYGEVPGWSVYSVAYDGQVYRCGATRAVDTDTIALEYSAEGWVMNVPGEIGGDSVAGTIDIDRASFEGRFHAGETGLLWFLQKDELALLRKAKRLAATPDGDEVQSIDLNRVVAAMKMVRECHAGNGVAPNPAKGAGKNIPPLVVINPANVPPQPVENETQHLGKGCPKWGRFASGASDLAVKASFVNRADRAVSVYWIGFDGVLVEYAGLLPGERFDVDTYEGHVWLGKDFDGTCLGGGAMFPVQGGKNNFALK